MMVKVKWLALSTYITFLHDSWERWVYWRTCQFVACILTSWISISLGSQLTSWHRALIWALMWSYWGHVLSFWSIPSWQKQLQQWMAPHESIIDFLQCFCDLQFQALRSQMKFAYLWDQFNYCLKKYSHPKRKIDVKPRSTFFVDGTVQSHVGAGMSQQTIYLPIIQ